MSEVVFKFKRDVMKDSPSLMTCSRSGAVKHSRATGARANFGTMAEMGRSENENGSRRRRRRRRKERMKRERENEGKEGIPGVTQTGVGIPYIPCTVSPRSAN